MEMASSWLRLACVIAAVVALSACGGGNPTGTRSPAVTTTSSPSALPSVLTPTTPDTCGAPPNKWYFTFCGGPPVTNAPYDFCHTFPCVDRFFSGTGYVVQCKDGLYSLTGGTPDACSGHGGVWRTLAEPH